MCSPNAVHWTPFTERSDLLNIQLASNNDIDDSSLPRIFSRAPHERNSKFKIWTLRLYENWCWQTLTVLIKARADVACFSFIFHLLDFLKFDGWLREDNSGALLMRFEQKPRILTPNLKLRILVLKNIVGVCSLYSLFGTLKPIWLFKLHCPNLHLKRTQVRHANTKHILRILNEFLRHFKVCDCFAYGLLGKDTSSTALIKRATFIPSATH